MIKLINHFITKKSSLNKLIYYHLKSSNIFKTPNFNNIKSYLKILTTKKIPKKSSQNFSGYLRKIPKHQNHILLFLILLTIGFIVYSSRQIFYYSYEPEYYENWYYHSQWNIPQSTRGISDGELYKFVGYQIVHGENPFYLNYQIPPFAKYLYGLAETYFHNPYWISLSLYIGSTLILYLLAKKLLKKNSLALTATLLFVTTPFVANQVRETMLDLPLMFLYLAHAYFFIKFLHKPSISSLTLAGIFLGLATGTKPPVYSPFVFILGFIFVLTQTPLIRNSLWYTSSVITGYLLSYISYFIHHPNPIPWIKLHKKTILFYLSPDSQVDHLNQWRSIFLNTYQGWWQTNSIVLGDWSPLLPIGVISALIIIIYSFKHRFTDTAYLALLTLIFLTINTFIPFWPRYLIPIIPLFIIMFIRITKKYIILSFILILLNLAPFFHTFSNPSPVGDIQASARFISTRAYRELYRSISPQQRKSLPEYQFINTMETFLNQLDTRAIQVKVSQPPILQSPTQAQQQLNITYHTKYGPINHKANLQLQKIHNQWKTIWSWNYLMENFTPNDKFIITEGDIPIQYLKSQNTILAQRIDWHTVYIIPRLMYDWNQSLDKLSKSINQNPIDVNQTIRTVIPDQYPRYIGYLDFNSSEDFVLSIPGASLKNNQYLKPTSNSTKLNVPEQISILNKQKPELFYTLAKVYLQKPNGEKQLILNTLDQPTNITIELPIH